MANRIVAEKTVRLVPKGAIERALVERVVLAVNEVIDNGHAKALDLVPVRKVFRYGRTRTGLRMQGRQEVRTLSLEEALEESVFRKRLGLASPFPTDASGRRLRNSQPLVRTAQFAENYRTRNRANLFNERRREIERAEILVDDRGRTFDFRPLSEPRLRDVEARRDLSARGRYELGRAKGDQLGGTLRDSVDVHHATFNRGVVTASITAGNEDAYYAKYVEFGTRRSRAQPFMRPAKALMREEYPDTMRRALTTARVGR